MEERQSWSQVLGDNLRRIREEKGLTLRELAARGGITLQHLSRVELGGADVSASTLSLLATGLDVHPARLLYRPPSRDQDSTDRAALLARGTALLDRMDTATMRLAVAVLEVHVQELIGRAAPVEPQKRRGRPRRADASE